MCTYIEARGVRLTVQFGHLKLVASRQNLFACSQCCKHRRARGVLFNIGCLAAEYELRLDGILLPTAEAPILGPVFTGLATGSVAGVDPRTKAFEAARSLHHLCEFLCEFLTCLERKKHHVLLRLSVLASALAKTTAAISTELFQIKM